MSSTSASAELQDAGVRAARDIVRICRRLYEAGLIAGQDGNVSVRLPNDRVLVTPGGLSKVELREEDLVVVDLEGRHVSGARMASSELDMHLRCYRARPDVHAVVHAHPPTATGWGVAGLDFMDDVLPETIFHLGPVPLVPYALPGTPALGDAMEPYLAQNDAWLLARHGATTVGSSLDVAHRRMESLEHAARILLAARALGPVVPLSPPDAQALHDARRAAREARAERQDRDDGDTR